jgi:predicted nucleotidyltransferase
METLRRVDEETIRQVRDRVVEACDPEAVILFGSAAHGETRPGSDLDLLVVMDLPEGVNHRQQASILHGLFRGWRLPLDILVRSPEHFDRGKRLLGMISNVAFEEGVYLHGNPRNRGAPVDRKGD